MSVRCNFLRASFPLSVAFILTSFQLRSSEELRSYAEADREQLIQKLNEFSAVLQQQAVREKDGEIANPTFFLIMISYFFIFFYLLIFAEGN